MKEPAQTCDLCGQPIKGQSYDLTCSITVYDRTTNEPIKTMIEPDTDVVGANYYVIGMDCCGHVVPNVWNGLLVQLGGME